MKQRDRILLALFVLGVSLVVLVPRPAVQSSSVGPPADQKLDARFTVVTQSDAPLCVSLTEATWLAPRWSATVTLSNCGSKDVSSFEIEYTEDYQNARGVWSSDGRSGAAIAVGGVAELKTGGGFADGLRNGTPVGDLEHLTVGLVSVTFADGSSWHKASKESDSPRGETRSN